MTPLLSTNTTSVVRTEDSNWFPSYRTCEYGWSYVGKIILLSRALINAAARSERILSLTGRDFAHKSKHFALQLKIFSIVSVPFSFVDLQSTAKKILSGFTLGDKESIALSSLSFTILFADIIDSLTTFINASLTLASADPIPLFAAMGLPLGFTMSLLGTISRTIQIGKNFLLSQGVQEHLDSTRHLKNYLRLALLNPLPPLAKEEMEHLLTLLEKGYSLSSKKVVSHLNTLFYLLERKTRIDLSALVANLLIFSALILFSLGSAAASPFILLSIAFLTRISSLIYQDSTQKGTS